VDPKPQQSGDGRSRGCSLMLAEASKQPQRAAKGTKQQPYRRPRLVSGLACADRRSMSSRAPGMRAGAYAEGRFRRGRASWRAQIRWVGLACFGPFVAGGLVVPFVYPRPLAIWAAGVVVGAAIAAYAVLADSPPAHVENWRTGAEGERKTARRLRALGNAQWLVVHDVDAGRGNYDHIVVGRAGVFLIDTKWPAGTLRIENGVPWITRREYPEAEVRYPQFGPRAKAAAARLSHDLGLRSERRVWVEPIVVVWSNFPAVIHAESGCTFIHGSHVVDWLQSRPARLEEAVAAALHDAVRALAAER